MTVRDAIVGSAWLLSGIAAAYWLYVYVGYDDGPWSIHLLLGVASVALLALAAFTIARRIFARRWSRMLGGFALCYTTIFVVLLVLMPSPEERMWLPVILVLGGISTFPAVAGAWVASANLFPSASGGNSQQADHRKMDKGRT